MLTKNLKNKVLIGMRWKEMLLQPIDAKGIQVMMMMFVALEKKDKKLMVAADEGANKYSLVFHL